MTSVLSSPISTNRNHILSGVKLRAETANVRHTVTLFNELKRLGGKGVDIPILLRVNLQETLQVH